MPSTILGRNLQQDHRSDSEHQPRLTTQHGQRHRNQNKRHEQRQRQQQPPVVVVAPPPVMISSSAASCASALTTPSDLLWRYDNARSNYADDDSDKLLDDEGEENTMIDVELSTATSSSKDQKKQNKMQQNQELGQITVRHPLTEEHDAAVLLHETNYNISGVQYHHRSHSSQLQQKQNQMHHPRDQEESGNVHGERYSKNAISEDRAGGGGRRRKQQQQRRRPWFASSSNHNNATASSSSSSPYVSSLRNSYNTSHHHQNPSDVNNNNNNINNISHHPHKNKTSYYNNNNSSSNSSALTSLSTGIQYFRTIDSTQRALRELQQQRAKKAEKKRALLLSILLFSMAIFIHGFGQWSKKNKRTSEKRRSGGGGGGGGEEDEEDIIGGTIGSEQNHEADTAKIVLMGGGGGGGGGGMVSTWEESLNSGGGGEAPSNTYGNVNDPPPPPPLPPPVEKTYEDDPDRQFLLPLRYYADMSDPYRRDTDTAFFFQVPRSGSGAVKDILGKCLRLVMCTEVGIRNGHGEDTVLQVLGGGGGEEEEEEDKKNKSNNGINVQGRIKYVNVDTTNAFGIQRAASMGLASSGLADVIVSSYFYDASMLFDLHHQGRAFLILRDPIERATSVYYHRVKTVGDLDASVITLEEYAKGNGIENNWLTRFLTNHMAGELTKDDLDRAKEILKTKFLIGFLDDLEESVYRIMKFNGWAIASEVDETTRMKQEDCIHDLITRGGVWSSSRWNEYEYDVPKRGTQAHALIAWQTQFDSKLFSYARELFDAQTKEWGTKERKKLMKKMLKNKNG